jgi:hypothetical protein
MSQNGVMPDSIDPRTLLNNEGASALRAFVSVDDVAAAWCRYMMRTMRHPTERGWTEDPDGWAAELYFEEEFWDVERRKSFLSRIAELAPNDDVLLTVGAQGLEDFISDDTESVTWIEKQAAASEKFRKALQNVHVSGLDPGTVSRLERAAGTQLVGGSDVAR